MKSEKSGEAQDIVTTFHNRLAEILDSKEPSHWSKLLGISKNLARDKWKKGQTFPRVDNIIKLLFYSGYSANWLLLGTGPMFLADAFDKNEVNRNEDDRRSMQNYVLELEEKVAKYQAVLEHVELDGKMKRLLASSPSIDDIESFSSDEIFENKIVPFATLHKLFTLLSFKFLEMLCGSKEGLETIQSIMSTIESTTEREKYHTLTALQDLDKLISKESLKKLLDNP